MDTSSIDIKGCPSQTSSPTPDESWGVDDLGRHAQSIDRAISDGEQSLTPHYWNLGLTLGLARCQFGYRQWGKFLSDLNIDPTRASKARAIHETFASAEQVSTLSVKEAYQQRKRKRRSSTRPTDKKVAAASASESALAVIDPPANLVQFFVELCRMVELYQFKAESATAEEAAVYLSALDTAAGELAKLRAVLSRKAAPN